MFSSNAQQETGSVLVCLWLMKEQKLWKMYSWEASVKKIESSFQRDITMQEEEAVPQSQRLAFHSPYKPTDSHVLGL